MSDNRISAFASAARTVAVESHANGSQIGRLDLELPAARSLLRDLKAAIATLEARQCIAELWGVPFDAARADGESFAFGDHTDVPRVLHLAIVNQVDKTVIGTHCGADDAGRAGPTWVTIDPASPRLCPACKAARTPDRVHRRARFTKKEAWRKAITFIALNDEPEDQDPTSVAGLISAQMAAEIFDEDPMTVAVCVLAERTRRDLAAAGHTP